MNYKTHKSTTDLETLKNIIADIEYLRRVGRNPWQGASGRRAMDKRFSYEETLKVSGKAVRVKVSTTASCNYTRFSVDVEIDGVAQRQYLKALKELVA